MADLLYLTNGDCLDTIDSMVNKRDAYTIHKLVTTTILWGRYFYSYFTDVKLRHREVKNVLKDIEVLWWNQQWNPWSPNAGVALFRSSWVRSGTWVLTVALLHQSSSSHFLKLLFFSLVIYQPSGYFILFIKYFDIRIFLSFLIHAITSRNSMFTWTTHPISYFNDFLTFLLFMVHFTSSPPMLLTNHQKYFNSQNCQHFALMKILIFLLRKPNSHCSSFFLWAFISIYHFHFFSIYQISYILDWF